MRHDPIVRARAKAAFLWIPIITAAMLGLFFWAFYTQANDAESRCVLSNGKRVCASMD